MKHSIAAAACAAALGASLAACSSGDDKTTLPSYTGGSTPPTTTTSRPATTQATATATANGPVALVAHSTYTYGGLKVMVNLPADIPSESKPSMRLFSEFLQGVGRTTAQNKLDSSLPGLASAEVVKYVRTFIEAGSVQGIGTVTFTITNAQTNSSGYTLIKGCVDQSKLVQVRKDGSHFIDANTRKYPTIKMTADINRVKTSREVTAFTYAVGAC